MICTFTPFLLLPDQVFNGGFLTLTLVGQYIVKNIVFVCALLIAYKVVNTRKAEEGTIERKSQGNGSMNAPAEQHVRKRTTVLKEPEILLKTSLGRD